MRRLGAALGAIGRRPRAALDLWGLYENAVLDGRTLAAALADLCSTLPPAHERPASIRTSGFFGRSGTSPGQGMPS